jgi:hypothetical protein
VILFQRVTAAEGLDWPTLAPLLADFHAIQRPGDPPLDPPTAIYDALLQQGILVVTLGHDEQGALAALAASIVAPSLRHQSHKIAAHDILHLVEGYRGLPHLNDLILAHEADCIAAGATRLLQSLPGVDHPVARILRGHGYVETETLFLKDT